MKIYFLKTYIKIEELFEQISNCAGAGEPEGQGAGVNSPGMRRRRSRVPSEEDDKLMNYLVSSGHDGSRERNLSVGNIGKILMLIAVLFIAI